MGKRLFSVLLVLSLAAAVLASPPPAVAQVADDVGGG